MSECLDKTDQIPNEKMITIKEALNECGVSAKTIRRWDKEGKLKPQGRTLQGWRYYLLTDVQEIIKDQKAIYNAKSKSYINDLEYKKIPEKGLYNPDNTTHALFLARNILLSVQNNDSESTAELCNSLLSLLDGRK